MSLTKGLILIVLDIVYASIMVNMSRVYNSGNMTFDKLILFTVLLVTIVVMPSWTRLTGLTGFGNKLEDEEKKKEHIEMMGIDSPIENVQVVEINIKDIIKYIIMNIITIIIFIILVI